MSVVLNGAAIVALIARPGLWPWWVGLMVADQLALVVAGLWPRCRLLGPNLRRLPDRPGRAAVALTFDDGPDPEVTPRVLDILDRYGARASFFCVGTRAAAHPEVVREIVRRGHHVENHTHTHRHRFAFLGPGGLEREIGEGQRSLASLAGDAPVHFRAPAGVRNLLLQRALDRHGLRLVSWTRRGFDTVTRDPARVAARLTRGLADGDILLLHDGSSARDGRGRPVMLDALESLLEHMRRQGLRAVALPRESRP